MSNQPFTFPPPPPPPPRRTADIVYQQNSGFADRRGAFRGGGSSYRGHNRGGRGGGYSNNNHRPVNTFNGYGQTSSSRPYNNHPVQRNSHMNPPQKRNHATAFTQPNNARSRPAAPPAVPSFNATIAHLLPFKSAVNPHPDPTPNQTQNPQQVPAPAKKNLLGLTPSHPDDSPSSEDEDEELRLSNTLITSSTPAQGLSFSYKGQLSALRTAAEIQAWIAERKKRFPTVAKAEAAKKEREEKKRKWEEEKAEKRRKWEEEKVERRRKSDEQQKAKEVAKQMAAVEKEIRNQGKNEVNGKKDKPAIEDTAAARAEAKAEKLRKRALKAERALKKAEEALLLAKEKRAKALDQQTATEKEDVDVQGDDESAAEASDPSASEREIDPDETSSSGSSSSDTGSDSDTSTSASSDSDSDDSGPETISTKDHTLSKRPPLPLPPEGPNPQKPPRICLNFLKYNRCKYGSSCRYSHDLSSHRKTQTQCEARTKAKTKTHNEKTQKAPQARSERRKGLYQVMVEKEEEEARRNVLEAIIALGEKGLLDEPPSAGK